MPHSTKEGHTEKELKNILTINDLISPYNHYFNKKKKWKNYGHLFKGKFKGKQKIVAYKIAKAYIDELLNEMIISNYRWYNRGIYIGVISSENTDNPDGKYNAKTNGKHYYVGVKVTHPKINWRKIRFGYYTIVVQKKYQDKLLKQLNNFHIYD